MRSVLGLCNHWVLGSPEVKTTTTTNNPCFWSSAWPYFFFLTHTFWTAGNGGGGEHSRADSRQHKGHCHRQKQHRDQQHTDLNLPKNLGGPCDWKQTIKKICLLFWKLLFKALEVSWQSLCCLPSHQAVSDTQVFEKYDFLSYLCCSCLAFHTSTSVQWCFALVKVGFSFLVCILSRNKFH